MRYWYYTTLAVMLIVSCSRTGSEPSQPDEAEEKSDIVDMITVSMGGYGNGATRSYEDIPLDDYDWMKPDEHPVDTPHDLFPKKFEEDSKIYIIQKTPSSSTKFPATEENSWETGALKAKYGNIMSIYTYKHNPNADWDKEYNFVPDTDDSALNWKTVRNNGSDGNAYKFYAYFFPVDNRTLSQKLDRNPDWSLNSLTTGDMTLKTGQWQSISQIDDLRSLDVMGAYHATPSLYSRMRLKFHHLMCYVRVTLYVPVVQPRYNRDDPQYKGDLPDEIVGYTGFDDNAFENNDNFSSTKGQPGVYIGSGGGAGITGLGGSKVVSINYVIDYNKVLNSNEDAPSVSPVYGGTSSNPAGVSLYLHRELYAKDSGNDISGASPVFTIDKEELGISYSGDDDRYDEVRRYEFSGYIPTQIGDRLYNNSNNPKKNIFYMTLKTPGTPPLDGKDTTMPTDGTYKYFTFKGTNSNGTANINFEQGNLMHFYLYVPRSGNTTIAIKANILPWQATVTDMTVAEDTEETNEQGENE